jgi:hypothetical protein
MASAARSLQRTSIIRDKDMDERFVTEVLPILWKVRTFVRKKSVLNQINFPVEITGRQAGLFAPERGLDTHNKSYFKLLNSATFEERMAAKRKELNAAGDKRKKQKAIELDRMADQLLGDLDINLDDDDDLLNDGGDDIDLDDDGDDEDED